MSITRKIDCHQQLSMFGIVSLEKARAVLALTIILAVLLLIICWVLFAPLRIAINSWENVYRAEWLWILSFSLIPTDDFFILKAKIPFRTFTIDPLKLSGKKNKEVKAEKKKDRKKSGLGRKGLMYLRKGITVFYRFIRSFRIRIFRVVFDTGDYVQNAQLQPLLLALRVRGLDIQSSFIGDSGLIFIGYNRISNIVYHGFRVFVMNK